jgi:hypothetical protein
MRWCPILYASPWTQARPFLAVPMYSDVATIDQNNDYRTLLSVSMVAPRLRDAPGAKNRLFWFVDVARSASESQSHLFLDPDTGITLPRRMPQGRKARKYVGVHEILRLLKANPSALLLCFDQSLSRGAEDRSRERKMRWLCGQGLHTAYFRSHASVLSASMQPHILDEWISGISHAGVPYDRIQRPSRDEDGPPLPE